MIMVMTPEAWTVVGTGVVVLIAIATSHRHLRDEFRREMRVFRDEIRGEMKAGHDELRGEMKAGRAEFRGETHQIHAEVGGLRERMARLEGLLEGLREAITGRKAA